MNVPIHTARDYSEALQALMPPGSAWEWAPGGFGSALSSGLAQELARVESARPAVLDRSVETHRPGVSSWSLSAYRALAAAALAGVVETLPRKPVAIGSRIGVRLWSHLAPVRTFPVPLVQVDHLVGPARVGNGHGSRMGDRLWGSRGRYVLRVRYYRSVVNPAVLWAALADFKQAQVFLWFEDITGVGGSYAPN